MGKGCGNGCLGTQGKTRDEAVTWTASNKQGGYEGGTSLVRWIASIEITRTSIAQGQEGSAILVETY